MKRLTFEKTTWKTLPKYFYKCENLNTFFNANHRLLSNTNIPSFYLEIHKIFIQHFISKPENIIEILIQPLWLNKHIGINNDLIYYKKYEKKGIVYLTDILNNNCTFLDYITLIETYDIRASFLDMIQIRSSIPIE